MVEYIETFTVCLSFLFLRTYYDVEYLNSIKTWTRTLAEEDMLHYSVGYPADVNIY
jgi:hypothetical protein